MHDQPFGAAPAARDVTMVMDALRALVRELRLSSRAVERAIGISGAQLFVLEQLADSPADSVNELADRTGTHRSSVSMVVSRLAKRALVTREPSAEDARRMAIAITDAGRALLASAPETAQHRIIAALRRTSPGQVHGLAEALVALMRAVGLTGEPVPMFFEDDTAEAS